MALYREQLEPHMYSAKQRKRKSYKWAKKQMNKWLRIKNKKEDILSMTITPIIGTVQGLRIPIEYWIVYVYSFEE